MLSVGPLVNSGILAIKFWESQSLFLTAWYVSTRNLHVVLGSTYINAVEKIDQVQEE